MSKWMFLALATTLGAAKLMFAPTNPQVDLQPTTPGTTQVGHLNIDGTANVGVLRSRSTVFGQNTSPTGTSYGGYFTVASSSGRGFYGYASSPAGLTYGGFFQNASSVGRAVYGLATATDSANYGGYFQAAGSSARGVLGVASSATGTTYGVYGKAVSAAGFGVYSEGNMGASGVISGNGSGVTGVNASKLGGYAVTSLGRLTATQTWTGTNAFSNAGVALRGTTSSSSGTGVYGTATATGGEPAGVRGLTYSPIGYGVHGYALNSTGRSYAVYGRSNGYDGRGVFGFAAATTGQPVAVKGDADSPTGYGVVGIAASTVGSNYGVFGRTYSATGVGVYSMGRFVATGTKSFRIDHPFNPANEYLYHYSMEMPEPQNAYNGITVTDGNGEAWVVLPDYFGEINTDFRYSLTIVDDSDSDQFVLAKVAREIRNNRFKIRTNAPNIKVSWRIEAKRNDLWMRRYGAPIEAMKDGVERGTYQHPELYGQPADRGSGPRAEKLVGTSERPSP